MLEPAETEGGNAYLDPSVMEEPIEGVEEDVEAPQVPGPTPKERIARFIESVNERASVPTEAVEENVQAPQVQGPTPQERFTGFMDAVKERASVIGGFTKEVATDIVNYTKNELTRPPQKTPCPTCQTMVDVPEDIFQYWICTQGCKLNLDQPTCPTHAEVQPAPENLKFELPCTKPDCGTQVPVPTNLRQSLQTLPEDAKKAYQKTTDAVVTMADAPQIFSCENCDSALYCPQGDWRCQVCQTVNAEAKPSCGKCKHSKYDQKVLCGVCHYSTNVPRNNFFQRLRQARNSLVREVRRNYLQVAQRPYMSCGRCSYEIVLTQAQIDASEIANLPLIVMCPVCKTQMSRRTGEFPAELDTKDLSSNGESKAEHQPMFINTEELPEQRNVLSSPIVQRAKSDEIVSIPSTSSETKDSVTTQLKMDEEVTSSPSTTDVKTPVSESVVSEPAPVETEVAQVEIAEEAQEPVVQDESVVAETDNGEDIKVESPATPTVQDGKECVSCGEFKPSSNYSKSQWKKPSGAGKCKVCTGQ